MAFYRTHRPLVFQDIIGQDKVKTILQQALLSQNGPHAYLFSGPRGTGKTSTARILARAANCLSPNTAQHLYEPCNQCPACQSHLKNQATDILEIDAASNRGIDDIRSLREQAQYPPTSLRRKVYIIDEVHMLTGEAFNALLKTLEEPPPHCLFILATTETHKVPQTIRSRCHNMRFDKGTPEFIVAKIDRIIAKESLNVEEGVSLLIANHADGGFRDAETLLESLVLQSNPLSLAQAKQALGLHSDEILTKIMDFICPLNHDQPYSEQLFNLLDWSALTVQELEQLTSQLLNKARALWLTDQNAPPSKPIPPAMAAFTLSQLLEAYILIKSAPSPELPLQIALLNIAQANLDNNNPESPLPALSSKKSPREEAAPEPIQPKTTNNHLPAKQVIEIKPQARPAENRPVPVIELREEYCKDTRKAWKIMCARIQEDHNLVLAQLLKETIIQTIQDNRINLIVQYKFHAEKLNEKKNSSLIQHILQDLTGIQWELVFNWSKNLPKEPDRAKIHSGANKDLATNPSSIDRQSLKQDASAIFGLGSR